MRKVLVLLMAVVCSEAFALELPDSVGEWRTASTHVVPLVTEYNHESHGRVVYRTYSRESLSGKIDVILTEGTGTGTLYVPENVNTRKGVMPADSGYEVVDIAGYKAILEHGRYIPISLAVNISQDTTLTIEANALGHNDVEEFAANMINAIKSSKRSLTK